MISKLFRFVCGHPGTRARFRFMLHGIPIRIKWKAALSRTHNPQMVSIITPTYRRYDKLREAIESVLRQSTDYWELLVVADGHDNHVRDIVKSYGDKRIRYLSTPWIGLTGHHQRNAGAVASLGEYLLFLDDDNLLYPQAIKTFTQGFTSPGIGYVTCPIDYEGLGILRPDPGLSIKSVDTLNFMIRREAIRKAGLWAWFYHADHDLITRVSRVSEGVHLDVPPIGIHR